MKACALFTTKRVGLDSLETERQILQSPRDGDNSTDDGGVPSNETSCADKRRDMEDNLFLLLAFVLVLCILGTLVSIASLVYMKCYKEKHTTARAAMSATATTTAATREKVQTMRHVNQTKATFVTHVVPLQDRMWASEQWNGGGAGLRQRSTSKSSDPTALAKATLHDTVMVNRRWSLEESSSGSQLLKATKQLFHFFKTGRYE